MTKVMVFQEFIESWRRQNPHDRVSKPGAIGIPWRLIIPIIIGVVAVNILSMAHTAPMIARTVNTADPNIKAVIALVGVLGVEFTMFVFMYVPMDSKDRTGTALRWLVIGAAFLVAMIANVSSTMEALQAVGGAEMIAAAIMGGFAPAANISAAEVLRKVLDRVTQARIEAEATYKEALIDEDKKLRNNYVAYLRRCGITDPTTVMRLMVGELPTQDATVNPEAPPVPKSPVVSKDELTGRALEIYNDIVANSLQEASQRDLVERYRTSPNTIARIKKFM